MEDSVTTPTERLIEGTRAKLERMTASPWRMTRMEEVEDAAGHLVQADARQNGYNADGIIYLRNTTDRLLHMLEIARAELQRTALAMALAGDVASGAARVLGEMDAVAEGRA